uniref:Uncharacterized protein LOC116940079 isoform X1 n=1 Tax=Petromyzon marinus TaxID=7757 RepID=A0AAJ7WPL2_PETMA|nr:uncharacterized protein LOC116940079 isoform X1 [Petromyzon marinus]XP_032805280.1 uncharacterized protein LOC116940079 isoform X1 [Petromyzon marinus]
MQQHPRPTFMASLKSRAAPSEGPTGKLCVHYVLVRHKVNGFGSLVAINSVLPTGQVLHIAPEAQVTCMPLSSLPPKIKMAITRTVARPPSGSSSTVTLISPIVVVGYRGAATAVHPNGTGGLVHTRSLSTGDFIDMAQAEDSCSRQHLHSSATSVLAWLKASRQTAPADRPGSEGGTVPPLPYSATPAACTAGHSVAAPTVASLGSYSIKAVASSTMVTSAGIADDNDVKIPVAVVHRGADKNAPARPPLPRSGGGAIPACDITATALREVTVTRVPNPGPSPAASTKGLGTLIVCDNWACVMLTERRGVSGDTVTHGRRAMADFSSIIAAGGDDAAPEASETSERLGDIDLGAGRLCNSAGVGVWHEHGNSARVLVHGSRVRGSRGSRDLPADKVKTAPLMGACRASGAGGEEVEVPCEEQMLLIPPDRWLLTDHKVPRVIKPPPEGVVLVPASQLQTPGAAERALLARAGIATDVRVYLLPVLHGRSGSRGSLCASSVPCVPNTPMHPRLTPHQAWHRPQPQAVAERRSTRLQRRSPRGAALPSLQHQPYRKQRLVPLVDVASLGTLPPWPRSHGDGASQETCEASEGSPCGSGSNDDVIFSSGDNGACNGMDWTNEVSWEGDVGESGGEAGSAPDPPPQRDGHLAGRSPRRRGAT